MADTADFKATETKHLFSLEVFWSTTTTVKKRRKNIPNGYISNIKSNVNLSLSFYRLIKPSGKKEKHLQGCNIFPPWKLTDECCSAKPLTHMYYFYTTYRDFMSLCAFTCVIRIFHSVLSTEEPSVFGALRIAALSVPHTTTATSCDFFFNLFPPLSHWILSWKIPSRLDLHPQWQNKSEVSENSPYTNKGEWQPVTAILQPDGGMCYSKEEVGG